MFGTLNDMFDKAVDILLSDYTVPVPQSVINAALSAMIITIPELSMILMEIHDGSFDLLVEGKKIISFKTRITFEITSCDISAEKQIIAFRRTSPAEISTDGLIDRILLLVFKSLVCRIFDIDPANLILEGQPGITVQGDNYTVDLSQTTLSGQIIPKLKSTLNLVGSLVRVKELRCVSEAFELVVGK